MSKSKTRQLKCSKCGAEFTCKPKGECWCNNYQLSIDQLQLLKEKYADCLCKNCLNSLSEAK